MATHSSSMPVYCCSRVSHQLQIRERQAECTYDKLGQNVHEETRDEENTLNAAISSFTHFSIATGEHWQKYNRKRVQWESANDEEASITSILNIFPEAKNLLKVEAPTPTFIETVSS